MFLTKNIHCRRRSAVGLKSHGYRTVAWTKKRYQILHRHSDEQQIWPPPKKKKKHVLKAKQFSDTSRFFRSSVRFSSGVFLLQLNLLRMASCSFCSLALISLASLKNWVKQPKMLISTVKFCFYSFRCWNEHLPRCRQSFLSDERGYTWWSGAANSTGSVRCPCRPAGGGAQQVVNTKPRDRLVVKGKHSGERKKKVSLESYLKPGGCCSGVHPLWFSACSAPSPSPPSPSSEPVRRAEHKPASKLAF